MILLIVFPVTVNEHGEVCHGEHRGYHCELELYALWEPPNVLLKKLKEALIF